MLGRLKNFAGDTTQRCRAAWEVKYGPVQWLVDVELGLGNWTGGLGMAERMAEKWK